MPELRSRGFGFGWGRRRDENEEEPAGAPGERAAAARPDRPASRGRAAAGSEAGTQAGEPRRERTREQAEPAEPGPESEAGELSSPVESGESYESEAPEPSYRRRRGDRWVRRPPPGGREPRPRDRRREDERYPDREEAELLLAVQEAEFRAVDWMLAADLEPDNRELIERYDEAAREAHERMEEYRERFGALMWMDEGWPARRHTGPFSLERR